MALKDFPTDLNGDYIEHTHLLSSDRAGWEQLDLIHELEPAGEMPETVLSAHSLVICLGDFQGSFLLNGQWHQEQYNQGDIALIAAGEIFPRVKIDRDVPLLELFLSPDILVNGIGEVNSDKVQMRSHLRLQDPLIQQITASSLRRLQSNPLTNWLVNNRRYLGLSMAISHGFHALAIAGVAILTTENLVKDNHSANLGYLFIILMVITSFKRPAAILSSRNWRILHTVGMYYLWLSFLVAFSGRLTESWLIYAPFTLILLLAIILRLVLTNKKISKKWRQISKS